MSNYRLRFCRHFSDRQFAERISNVRRGRRFPSKVPLSSLREPSTYAVHTFFLFLGLLPPCQMQSNATFSSFCQILGYPSPPYQRGRYMWMAHFLFCSSSDAKINQVWNHGKRRDDAIRISQAMLTNPLLIRCPPHRTLYGQLGVWLPDPC